MPQPIKMEWLNYHHLLYFWTVVREGGVASAAKVLGLSHPTVSSQVHALEESLGEVLLVKQGRRLVMTDVGQHVYRYAEEIFTLGREMVDTIRGQPTGRPLRLAIGIAQVVPKLIAREIISKAGLDHNGVFMQFKEAATERLLTDLAQHELDVVISDAPLGPSASIRGFNHFLGECDVTIFAAPTLAKRLKGKFPQCLEGMPFLMPTGQFAVRRALTAWFESQGTRPTIVAEFDDSELLKVFGQDGMGLFASSSALTATIVKTYDVRPIGVVPAVRERFYAISLERRIKHPAVVAICDAARDKLFA